eukprot:COSAG02_NODE_22386_length_754_cov_1.201527_1_plen_45_part_10
MYLAGGMIVLGAGKYWTMVESSHVQSIKSAQVRRPTLVLLPMAME